MKIDDFVLGWLVGDFEPSLIKTPELEVGIKYYKAGFVDKSHYHKIAVEYTVIISGKVRMNDITYNSGDIVTTNPYEIANFMCLEDCATLVIKAPSVTEDKYLINE
jgi:hypothetical protein